MGQMIFDEGAKTWVNNSLFQQMVVINRTGPLANTLYKNQNVRT